jgi:hypothetical protein
MSKRNLSALEQQRHEMERLMANPEKAIKLPGSSQSKEEENTSEHQIPNYVPATRSSTAGAGSGEFHVYKNTKRKNLSRQEEEEGAVRAQKEAEDFVKRRREAQIRDEQKTEKNRQKRRKRTNKSKKKTQFQNSSHSNDTSKQDSHSKTLDIEDSQNHQKETKSEQPQDTQTPNSPSHGIKIVEDTF